MQFYQKEKVQKNLESEAKKQQLIQQRQNLQAHSDESKKQKAESKVTIRVNEDSSSQPLSQVADSLPD